MLKMLGQVEVDAALADLGTLAIDCDFCSHNYQFDKVDCAQLFASDNGANVLNAPENVKH